jgi:hypothetical protein
MFITLLLPKSRFFDYLKAFIKIQKKNFTCVLGLRLLFFDYKKFVLDYFLRGYIIKTLLKAHVYIYNLAKKIVNTLHFFLINATIIYKNFK